MKMISPEQANYLAEAQQKAAKKSAIKDGEAHSPSPRGFPQGLPFEDENLNWILKLIETTGIPQSMLHQLWGVINQVHVLTNLTEPDIRIAERELDNIFTRYRMSIPEYDYSYDMDIALKEVEFFFRSQIRRSKLGFERTMIQHSSRTVEYIDTQREKPRTGVRGALGKFFGKG